MDRAQISQLACMFGDANERVTLPPPAILKVRWWEFMTAYAQA